MTYCKNYKYAYVSPVIQVGEMEARMRDVPPLREGVVNMVSSTQAHDENLWNEELLESENLLFAMWHTCRILGAHYIKSDLHNAASNNKVLTHNKRNALRNIPTK